MEKVDKLKVKEGQVRCSVYEAKVTKETQKIK